MHYRWPTNLFSMTDLVTAGFSWNALEQSIMGTPKGDSTELSERVDLETMTIAETFVKTAIVRFARSFRCASKP